MKGCAFCNGLGPRITRCQSSLNQVPSSQSNYFKNNFLQTQCPEKLRISKKTAHISTKFKSYLSPHRLHITTSISWKVSFWTSLTSVYSRNHLISFLFAQDCHLQISKSSLWSKHQVFPYNHCLFSYPIISNHSRITVEPLFPWLFFCIMVKVMVMAHQHMWPFPIIGMY